MRKMLNNWKHYWQEELTEVKASSKVSYPSFVSIAMKLVILLQDVHRRRATKMKTSTKRKENMIAKITKTKARSHATLMKKEVGMILMNMMIKWCML